MTQQSLLSVGIFLLLLACVPFLLKWLKARAGNGQHSAGSPSRIVSALAVGPHQRVVTVEVGDGDARVRLTLGVTAQTITCLHSAPVEGSGKIQTQR
jgi:flagellar protein FliO/FliZ